MSSNSLAVYELVGWMQTAFHLLLEQYLCLWAECDIHVQTPSLEIITSTHHFAACSARSCFASSSAITQYAVTSTALSSIHLTNLAASS